MIAIIAIIWGVGGVAALYTIANWLVEQMPDKWKTLLRPFVFVGPALALLDACAAAVAPPSLAPLVGRGAAGVLFDACLSPGAYAPKGSGDKQQAGRPEG